MPAEQIANNDVLRIYERVGEAAQKLRAGEPGPFFFECLTYRLKEHVGPNEDFHLGFRSRDEAAPWIETDPVRRLAERIPATERLKIESEVEAEICDAFAFAESSPFPPSAELYTDVFGS
jgi:TPP-dependent pyruvate/acetoin dehydrogenase alpha subunit